MSFFSLQKKDKPLPVVVQLQEYFLLLVEVIPGYHARSYSRKRPTMSSTMKFDEEDDWECANCEGSFNEDERK